MTTPTGDEPKPPITFVAVTVHLTEVEYRRLREHAALTGEGTVAAALRQEAGMQQVPLGWRQEGRRQVISAREYRRKVQPG